MDRPKESGIALLGGVQRMSVFINGMGILALLLVPYILSQLVALYLVDNEGLINPKIMGYSIYLNLILLGFLSVIYIFFKKQKNANADEPVIYFLMVFAAGSVFVASLIHLHFVGSQNSLHHLLIVAVLLVVSWFFTWRDVILFFILGNLGLASIVALESFGILKYAPLFDKSAQLAAIFLDWRVILSQTINYILVLVVTTILIWKFRKTLEVSEKLRNEANEALKTEVQERIQSEKEKEELIAQLKQSLDKVKTLEGLLPICMNCKSVRDDQGYWIRLESYFKEHSPDLEFSHGLCPKCAQELYPDEWKKEGGK